MENDFDPGCRLGRVGAVSRFAEPSTTRRDGLVTKCPEVSPLSSPPPPRAPSPHHPTPAPKTITVFFYGDKAIHFLGCASYGHCARTHTATFSHTERHTHTQRETGTHAVHMPSQKTHRRTPRALKKKFKKKNLKTNLEEKKKQPFYDY